MLNLPNPFDKDEAFLFSCVEGDQLMVVRVLARGHDAAVTRFRSMNAAERRHYAVSRLARRDRDHFIALTSWFERFLPRAGRRNRVSA